MTHFIFSQVDVVDLARSIETPFYLFSEDIIKTNYNYLKEIGNTIFEFLPSYTIAYSIKNAFIPVLVDTLAHEECMFEVTSQGEMALLSKLGVHLDRCIYTNIWKPRETVEMALDKSAIIAIDSISDFRHVVSVAEKVNKTVRALIRVNPAIAMKNTIFASSTPDSKTGVEITESEEESTENAHMLADMCFRHPLVQLVGLHGHLGSQVTNMNYYKEFTNKITSFYKYVKTNISPDVHILDLGGGLPVPYRNPKVVPSAEDIFTTIAHSIRSYDVYPHLISEIGRYITSPAGILVTRVVGIKENSSIGKILITDASAYNELLDSVLVHWDFDMIIANKVGYPNDTQVWVVGGTTDSIDAYDPLHTWSNRHPARFLPSPEEGDILVILSAGAYTTCFNMNYCLRPIPAIYWINSSGRVIEVRRRQKLYEMFSLFSFP